MTAAIPLSTGMSTGALVSASVGRDDHSASLAAIAREELARIYGGLVREHHGHAVPLHADDTRWERARLGRAARELTRGDK